MKQFLELRNGKQMPLVGYGMWQSDNPSELEAALDIALEAGYRHFDTAWGYRNEKVFGKVLKRWFDENKVTRGQLFITTKLPMPGNHPDRARRFLEDSLKDLQLSYVDLYLIHNPATTQAGPDGFTTLRDEQGQVAIDTSATLEDTWRVLQECVKEGKCRAIGLSSFSLDQVERICKVGGVLPSNHQIELNAYYPRKAMRDLCKKYGITVCAFAPLGSPGRKDYSMYTATKANLSAKIPPLLEDKAVAEIAKKHGKSPAQILLRFIAQQDIVVIPKSVTRKRIYENFDIYNFTLDAQDMTKLDALDQKVEGGTWGFDWKNVYPGIEKHPEFTLEG